MSETLPLRHPQKWADRPFVSRFSRFSTEPFGLQVWWVLTVISLTATIGVVLRFTVIAKRYEKLHADAVMWQILDEAETAVFVLDGVDGKTIDINANAKRRFPFAIVDGRMTNNLPYGDGIRDVVANNIQRALENGHYYVTVARLPRTVDGRSQAAVIRTSVADKNIRTLLTINTTDTILDLRDMPEEND